MFLWGPYNLWFQSLRLDPCNQLFLCSLSLRLDLCNLSRRLDLCNRLDPCSLWFQWYPLFLWDPLFLWGPYNLWFQSLRLDPCNQLFLCSLSLRLDLCNLSRRLDLCNRLDPCSLWFQWYQLFLWDLLFLWGHQCRPS